MERQVTQDFEKNSSEKNRPESSDLAEICMDKIKQFRDI